MKQTEALPLPNPGDWCDAKEAAALLLVSRSTLYAMVRDGRLTDYQIGTIRVFWRPEILEVSAALRRVRAR